MNLTILLISLALLLVPSLADALSATEKATFAGGCFWCMEKPFEKLEGVISVESGYTGGTKDNPTYEEVSAGITGHAEAVQIEYDPSKISYSELLDVFWKQIDPTDSGGAVCGPGNPVPIGNFLSFRGTEKPGRGIEKNA